MSTSFCQALSTTLGRFALVIFCTEVGSYAVDDDEPDVASLDSNWDLEPDDVFLCFQVMDVRAINASERWLLVGCKTR